MKKNERYPCLDTLRGYTLFSMVVYHAIWDIVYIKGVHIEWFHSVFACIWQQSICWTFILLSGFCWNLGKRKVIRGGVIFSAGILVSFVTEIFIPQQKISFGVLTLFGKQYAHYDSSQPKTAQNSSPLRNEPEYACICCNKVYK